MSLYHISSELNAIIDVILDGGADSPELIAASRRLLLPGEPSVTETSASVPSVFWMTMPASCSAMWPVAEETVTATAYISFVPLR